MLELSRPLVLIGLMGAGKSCIGRRLAQRLSLDFVDADHEIETAAGCSISDIFALYGESAFREGERKVMARLLDGSARIVAAGGGAFMDPATREIVRARGISLWLRAELDLLIKRTAGRDHRPLLNQGDPREILGRLIQRRYPVYAEADIVVDSRDEPPERTVDAVLAAVAAYLEKAA